MIHTRQYLEKYCKKLTKEEAQKHLDEGTGYISSGGYTLCNVEGKYPRYFASGVFPGCLRGGNVSLDVSDGWYLLTLKDVICTHGFYPDPFMMTNVTRMQSDMKDYEIHIDDLIVKCINAKDTAEVLKHPMKAPAIWQKYFKIQK